MASTSHSSPCMELHKWKETLGVKSPEMPPYLFLESTEHSSPRPVLP